MSEGSDRRRSEGLPQQQMLLDQLVGEVVERAPDGWVRIESVIVSLGGLHQIASEIFTAEGPFYGPPLISFPATTPQLRDVMYVEGRGTWLSLSLTVWSSGEVSTAFDYDTRPPMRAFIGHSLRDDLVKYPREVLPPWMIEELAGIDAADQDYRERIERSRAEEVLEGSEPVMERDAARELARGYVPEEPDWHYVRVAYAERGEWEPVLVFVEVDDEGYEFRKVEVFRNGSLAFSSISFASELATTSDDPLPPVEELTLLPEVVAAEPISPEAFQEEWLIATGVA